MSKTLFRENCLLLVVCKSSYNHRDSGLWEIRRWAKVGKRGLPLPWLSAMTFTTRKAKGSGSADSSPWGLPPLTGLERYPELLGQTLTYGHTDVPHITLTHGHTGILLHPLTHSGIL